MADQDNYSDIQQEVPKNMDEGDPQNVLRGHKATISNQNTSDKAKEHSRAVLESYEEPYDARQSQSKSSDQSEKDPRNIARGLKASISNPGVSEEAKERAEEKLADLQS
ncbi:hypothetical protein DL766_007884 [Monosporascus sp. MC13-8B]|nr:hypothetical protein DL766_007884 [Monosporascus sp. MC13-8B]